MKIITQIKVKDKRTTEEEVGKIVKITGNGKLGNH